MLLLRSEREAWNKLSPEEMQKAVERYYAWRKNPFVVDGKGLNSETGRVLRKKNGTVNVTDGPFSESREVFGGYYVIEAASFDEAVQFSMDQPHLEFGGVEIREVIKP
jgi:hypothetical protein